MLVEQAVAGSLTQNLAETPGEDRPQASEICVFCNLYDLFTKYSINEVGPAQEENDFSRVLQPRNVRNALSQLNVDNIAG